MRITLGTITLAGLAALTACGSSAPAASSTGSSLGSTSTAPSTSASAGTTTVHGSGYTYTLPAGWSPNSHADMSDDTSYVTTVNGQQVTLVTTLVDPMATGAHGGAILNSRDVISALSQWTNAGDPSFSNPSTVTVDGEQGDSVVGTASQVMEDVFTVHGNKAYSILLASTSPIDPSIASDIVASWKWDPTSKSSINSDAMTSDESRL